MTPDPTVTDEELKEMGRLWMAAYQDVGTSTLAYKSLVTFPRLIAALRASRTGIDELLAAVAAERKESTRLDAALRASREEVERLQDLMDDHECTPYGP